jgi:hypothetical protein
MDSPTAVPQLRSEGTGMTQRTVPVWAIQRVSAAVEAQKKRPGGHHINPTEVARRTGLSKSLTRHCLFLLKRQ